MYFPNSNSEVKAAAVQDDEGESKKKLKMKKKKRLKEEVRLWEESRRCSNGQEEEERDVPEPLSEKITTENDKLSKQSTGTWAWNRMNTQHDHAVQTTVGIVWLCCCANTKHVISFYTD